MKNIAKVTALALGIALASGYAAAEEKLLLLMQVIFFNITQIAKR